HHLTYCTNIHPGESWEDTFGELRHYLPLVREQVAGGEAMGVGLRLSDRASRELDGGQLATFKDWLAGNNLYVFTMNGFPFGAFHHQRVKDLVHYPDWRSEERLEYTLRLFSQLE